MSRRATIRQIDLFEELYRRKQMTPDFEDLMCLNEHLVFIYDNYKQQFPLYKEYLSNSKYLGVARTLETTYQLMVTPSGTLPILLANERQVRGDQPNYHAIRGEVYAVPTEDLIRLDSVHDNTRLFCREQKYCVLEDQTSPFKVDPATNKRPPLARQCHMYLGIGQVWDNCQLHFGPKTIVGDRTYWDWRQQDHTKRQSVH